ncbi:hypothetical protein BD626DRAFT_565407 [Schizophyllum amplum]|uniref:Uncharacterized protein n=1 Tax=Schizophyllum amplum TaxID=97359 RepID=A0A550CUX0_9AGAR|nr:hypothetical protein BD626DRAFT_565407 [Auriculariopsis ampla]
MSMSVDDLVSSFASSHIGQEAIDLAALQAQLAQVLFGQPNVEAAPVPAQYTQRCNTPIQRTPSSSFSFGHMQDSPRYMAESPRTPSSGPGSWRSVDSYAAEDDDMMDEEERMVEELLLPSRQTRSPPQSPVPSKPFSSFSYPAPTSPLYSEPSAFATTDPFFLAQAQAQTSPMPSTFFAQSGHPSQQSPFLMQQNAAYHGVHEGHPFTAAQTMVSS